MRHAIKQEQPEQPIEACARFIGSKWKGAILHHLSDGPKRFNELRRALPNATQRALTATLRDLESDGILVRKIYAEVPPRVEYSISVLGTTLRPVLIAMDNWGRWYRAQHRESSGSKY